MLGRQAWGCGVRGVLGGTRLGGWSWSLPAGPQEGLDPGCTVPLGLALGRVNPLAPPRRNGQEGPGPEGVGEG